MKKLVFFAAAFAVILACSKESQEPQGAQETNNNNTTEEVVDDSNTVHELFVSLPDFTDAETKATINDANGYFSWTTGDKIAVVDDKGNVYPFVASTSAQTVRFTYVGSIAGSLETIYYPYIEESPYYITDMPTSLDSETAVLTSSKIRLSGTIEGNSATLSHNHAFVRLKFENVPSFATKIQFYESGNEIPTEVTLTGTGSVTAYLPVHDGTQAITASLLDDNDNVIIQKYHNFGEENAFVKGSIKNMRALTVGHVFTFKNDAGWDDVRVSIWNGDNNAEFRTNYGYPYKLNELSGKYYILLNSDVSLSGPKALSEVNNIGVWFGNADEGDHNDGTQTDRVYILRDIDFTIPIGAGDHEMIADYYIYPHGTNSIAAAYLYATYSTGTYDIPDNIEFTVTQEGTQWSSLKWYGNNGSIISSSFPGDAISNSKFSISRDDIIGKSLTFVISKGDEPYPDNWANWKQTEDLFIDFSTSPNNHVSSVSISLSSSWSSGADKRNIGSSISYSEEVLEYPLGTSPGTSITVPSEISAENYVRIDSQYAGKTLNFYFKNSGGDTIRDWQNLPMNQDWDYGL